MSRFVLLPLAALSFYTLANDNQELEKIAVTATRAAVPVSTVPATVSVISQQQIQQQLAFTQDISQILGNLLPAFSPSRQKLTSSGETLRGREPLYMIDGVPQSNPLRSGGRDGNTIDPAMIERIEVIRGSNAIQGMGASGGIINIITKSAGDNPHQVAAGFSTPTSGGSDSQSMKASYLFSHGDNNNGLVAGVSMRTTGMYRDANGELIGIDSTQGDTMDSDSLDVFVKYTAQLDKEQSLQWMVNHYNIEGNGDYQPVVGDVDNGVPATSIEGEPEGGAPRNRVTTSSLDYQHQNVFGGQLSWQLFYQDFAALYGGSAAGTFQDPDYGDNLFDQSQNKSKKLGSRLTWFKGNWGGSHLDVISGIDWLQDETFQELAITGRKWVPETQFNNIAPFAQLRFRGVDNLTLSYGVRYEYGKLKVDDFTTLASYNSTFVEGGSPSFNELLNNAGIVWQTTPELRLYASYSEGFSMPDVGRVLRGINVAGLSVSSFLDLQPVISDNREVGFEYTNNWLHLQSSYFQSDSDLGSRLAANADGIYSVKREKTEIAGFETDGQIFIDNTTIGATYARAAGQYDGDQDGVVETDLGGVNIAPQRLNLYWMQQWSNGLSSRLQLNMLFDMNFNSGNDFDGYNSVDLAINYQHDQYGLFSLGLDNLTDKQYIGYYAQTNGANNRYFAGTGRTLSLNWQHSF
ncbi:TonB-dependent receptor [Neptunicella sp.]|uniref:TonB-dependent receptor n=1 Tax=Neptunicella sp. TaxID=2125986 RepID=UPI003F691BB6